MLSTTALISRLKTDYPQFSFKKSDIFSWAPSEKVIYYNTKDNNSYIFILHELSHALLSHANYGHDVELIAMERDAWDKAIELATNYGLEINNEATQLNLDTYRDWLHARSICPTCSATGLQSDKNAYRCLACGHKWQVNEARSCSLRRYSLKK